MNKNNTNKLFLGIDPGKSGAAALIDENRYCFSSTEFSKDGYAKIFSMVEEPFIVLAAIEDVHAIHGSSAKATFTFGRELGRLLGIFDALKISYELVTPKIWQKIYSFPALPRSDKKRKKLQHVETAERLFKSHNPNLSFRGDRGGLKDGLADAFLIAEWLRRREVGQ